MNKQSSTGSRSTTRIVVMAFGLITLASLLSSCIFVPEPGPRAYHPYYRPY